MSAYASVRVDFDQRTRRPPDATQADTHGNPRSTFSRSATRTRVTRPGSAGAWTSGSPVVGAAAGMTGFGCALWATMPEPTNLPTPIAGHRRHPRTAGYEQ